MPEPLPVVIEDDWELYSFNTENGPASVSFFAGEDVIPRDEYPHCARVIVPVRDADESGMPRNDEEAARLWKMEDDLTDMLTKHKTRCVFVARLTHGGDRELVFQLNDWEAFRTPVGLWMMESGQDDLDVSEHEGWDFFDDVIWPDDDGWRMIHDRKVYDNLIRLGSDPEKDHELDFVFHGEPAALQKLAMRLKREGYTLQDGQGDEADDEGTLVLVKRTPLDLAWIWNTSDELTALCDELGVDFDGWGAAVVP